MLDLRLMIHRVAELARYAHLSERMPVLSPTVTNAPAVLIDGVVIACLKLGGFR